MDKRGLPSSARKTETNLDKIKMLVVDDKKIIGDLFDFTFGYSGHKVTVVTNAKDALAAVTKDSFDVAFLAKDGFKDIVKILQRYLVVHSDFSCRLY